MKSEYVGKVKKKNNNKGSWHASVCYKSLGNESKLELLVFSEILIHSLFSHPYAISGKWPLVDGLNPLQSFFYYLNF